MRDRILLVGSGGSLKDSKLGNLIDNFEGLICRFNLYNIEGFEKDVGNKTDIWCINAKMYFDTYFEGEYKLNDNKKITFEDLENFKGNLLVAGTRHLWGKFADSGYMQEALDELDKAKVMTTESLELGFNLIKSHKYCQVCERNHNMIPSTGIQAILHYLNLDYEVYLVGFDSTNNNISKSNTHYYSEHKYNEGGSNLNTIVMEDYRHPNFIEQQHNQQREKEIINILETLKCVKRLD